MLRQCIALPSIAAVRAGLIQERLRHHARARGQLPRIVATGQTGAGKSTLGNKLLGAERTLDSNGRINCTDRVHRVRFHRGLEYVDLPGVASDEAYENYNRIALGLPQVSSWPQATRLTVVSHTPDGGSAEATYPWDDMSAASLRPDVVLYLIAPHRAFGYSDAAYLADLLAVYSIERILFVLNLFGDRTGEVDVATEENVTDILDEVAKACHDAGQALAPEKVVRVNCRSGEGIPALIDAMAASVPARLRAPLVDVLRHQRQHAPQRWLAALSEELSRFLTVVAAETPNSEQDAAATLAGYRDDLLAVFAAAASPPSPAYRWPDPLTATFDKLAGPLVKRLRREHTEPILEPEVVPVEYEDVPIWDTRKETDYDNPKIEKEKVWETRWVEEAPDLDEIFEAFDTLLDRGRFVVRRKRPVFVGYRDKIVGYHNREVRYIARYDRRVTRTETVMREVGRRTVAVTFKPFGHPAAVLLLATCLVVIDDLAANAANAVSEDRHRLKRRQKIVRQHLGDSLDVAAVLALPDVERSLSLAMGLA